MSIWTRIFGVDKRPKAGQKEADFRDNVTALRNLPRFLRLIWATDPAMAASNVALRIVKAATPLAILYVGKLIIDEVILQAGLDNTDLSRMWMLVAVEFILAILTGVLSRAINLLDALLGDLFANLSSVKLIEHAASLDLPQFEDGEFYDKLERARTQTLSRTMLMSEILLQLQDAITIIFLAGGLIVFNPWLILILILALIPIFLNENYFNQRSYSLTRNWTPERRELDYLRYIGASNETAKEIKVFGLAEFLKERFGTLADRYYHANRSLSVRRAVWGSFFNTLGDLGYYAAYVVIIIQTVNGRISVGDLTFLAGSFNRMRNLLQGMLSRFSNIAQRALYLQDLFDFFDMEPKIALDTKAKSFPSQLVGSLVFENVGFQYPGSDQWAVRGLSFELKAGEKLALVGENGAGKTTLAKLLVRLYDPGEGRILIDGVDIRDYRLDQLRNAVGVIFQDYVRFQMTANDNIAVGKIDEIDEREKVVNSAVQSLADQVVDKLPKGYDQMLGKRFSGGVDLSGGEWQKVALGRAYMRDAQLLILDEPTASLDARAEFEVFQRFSELTRGKTAVLISHRFSTVRMADKILVLKGGKMVELGTHEELLELDGYYAELFNLQAIGYR